MVAGKPPKLTVLVLVESACEEQVWRQVHGRLYSGGAEARHFMQIYIGHCVHKKGVCILA